jgi:hypothetical protein
MPGDEAWWDGFNLPVTDGIVNAAINYQGSLIIAGRFTRIGDVMVNNIARWNGATWVPLGTGIEEGAVSCLVLYQGDVVAGGDFWYAGGVLARSIARWDGSIWSAFSATLQNPNIITRRVMSMAAHGDTLVAAQDAWYEYSYPFPPNPAPTWPYLVNLWNGTDWVDLQGANRGVNSMCFFDGTLFAGGSFDSIGGVPAERIARLDGASWSEVGGGLGPISGVLAMSVHSNQLVLGGFIESAGAVDVGNVATWNGVEWGALGSLPPGVSTLSSSGGQLLAGGPNMVARWNGQSWEFPTPPVEGSPSSIVTLGTDLVVAGPIAFRNAAGTAPAALYVAKLSNDVWVPLMPLGGGMQGLVSLDGFGYVGSLAAYRGHVIAAGTFQYAGSPSGWEPVDRMAEWTGTEWAPFPLPANFEFVTALVSERDTLYAAGYSNQDPLTPAIWRHDGTEWEPLGTQPGFVYAMTTYQGSIVASFGGPLVLRWTGSEWEEIGRAEGGGYPIVWSMVEWDGKLVVAGRFQSVDQVPCSNIAAWNGYVWEPIGPGLPSPPNFQDGLVRSLGVADGNLAATKDGINGVTYWSGTAWERLGSLQGSQAYLFQAGQYLFVSGYLYDEQAPHELSLARWHQDAWVDLGSGTNSPVSCVAALGTSVYMGGFISEAGGKASYAIARWDDVLAPQVTPVLEAARPNPFATQTAFTYTLPTPGTVRLAIHDVRGREIALIDQGSRSTGSHTVTWYGRDRSGERVPSGVYFVSASLPGGVHKSRKVILLK